MRKFTFLFLILAAVTSLAQVPTGAINGVFSVGECSQVYFSRGNLQYQASTKKWRFAANQWDYIGSANSNISSTYTGWIDLFGWGTGNNPTKTSTSSSSYSTFTDWGINPISNGGNTANQWRTLTKDEWIYLMKTRTTPSGIRYAKATVNGKTGVIILPDDWSSSYYSLNSTNSTGVAFSVNTITSTNWTSIFEAHGAVFLPAAGIRSGTNVLYVSSWGVYHSSSSYDSNNAYILLFTSGELYCSYHTRYEGRSVRLVQPVPKSSYSIEGNPCTIEGGTVTGAGTYQQCQECTLTATSNEGYTFTYWTENGEVVSYDATYTFTVDGNRNIVANFMPQGVPTGAINGFFSVGECSQVYFSQGNLQYKASANTWRFAANQWDYVGDANANISSTYSGWIDLFGYATSGYNHGAVAYQPYSTSTNNKDYYAYGNADYNLCDQTGKADWGYNAISNGGNEVNIWRTLTKDEWNYLMFTRTTASCIRYAKATVDGKPGVIILPDNWNTSYYTLNSTNNVSSAFTTNTITSANWTSKFEANGAVFLPATGRRIGTSIDDVGLGGRYWSSTSNGTSLAFDLYFYGDSLDVYGGNRLNGFSVRLVQPAPKYSYSIEGNPCTIEGGMVTGAGTYQQCQECTLMATANEGYVFSYWTENGEVVSTDAVYTFAVDGNRNLVAVFTENVTLEPVTACDSYIWHGETYTQSGTLTFDTLTTEGCPRHETLVLTINESQAEAYTETACDEYTWHGTPYSVSGTYTYDSTLTNGCHRIETLNLTINESQAETYTETACDEYTWHSTPYTESGTYTYDSTLTNGCHRIETLNLTINESQAETYTETACDEYTWYGTPYTVSGTYTYDSTLTNGCHRIETLNLTINASQAETFTETACDSYTWHGQTHEVSGTYTYDSTLTNGCHRIETLNLTINASQAETFTETACDSYTWHGQTHEVSGTYTYDSTLANGCYRIETLNLTINESQAETYTETACDEYLWHGTTYTESGTYTYDSTLTNGCHRIETLNLTINYSEAETFDVTVCDIYTWYGQNYTESGVYTNVSTNAGGCPRVETLNLTIPVVEAVITGVTEIELGNETTLTAEGGMSYVWSTGDTTQNIIVSPDTDTNYSVIVTDVNGCAATAEVTIHVTEGITEIENDVKIYPNPTENIVNIEADGMARIKLFDMMGQVLFEKQVQGNNTQIDLRQYAVGQYFVQINTEKTSIVKKVVKK